MARRERLLFSCGSLNLLSGEAPCKIPSSVGWASDCDLKPLELGGQANDFVAAWRAGPAAHPPDMPSLYQRPEPEDQQEDGQERIEGEVQKSKQW